MSDLRHAARSLLRTPALTAIAIRSLALGIGANVTAVSVVREMIPDDITARRPEQLASVNGVAISYTLYRELRLARLMISRFIAA